MSDVIMSCQQTEDASIGVNRTTNDMLYLTDDILIAQTGRKALAVTLFEFQHHDKQTLLCQCLRYLHIIVIMKPLCYHQHSWYTTYQQCFQYLLFQFRCVKAHYTSPFIKTLHPLEYRFVAG